MCKHQYNNKKKRIHNSVANTTALIRGRLEVKTYVSITLNTLFFISHKLSLWVVLCVELYWTPYFRMKSKTFSIAFDKWPPLWSPFYCIVERYISRGTILKIRGENVSELYQPQCETLTQILAFTQVGFWIFNLLLRPDQDLSRYISWIRRQD